MQQHPPPPKVASFTKESEVQRKSTCRTLSAAELILVGVLAVGVTGLGGGGRKVVGPPSVSAFAIVAQDLGFGGSGAVTATGAGAAGKLAAAGSIAPLLLPSTAGFTSAVVLVFAGSAELPDASGATSAALSGTLAALLSSLAAGAGSWAGVAAVLLSTFGAWTEGAGVWVVAVAEAAASVVGSAEAGCAGAGDTAAGRAANGREVVAG